MSTTTSAKSPPPHVPLGVRKAFQVDGLFELVVGSVLMGNPLTGPDLGISSGLVSLAGVLFLITAIVLGGAGLGKGPLAQRLRLVTTVNVISAIATLLWAVTCNGLGARVLLLLIGVGLAAISVVQTLAIRRPNGSNNQRRQPTREELQAALRGE